MAATATLRSPDLSAARPRRTPDLYEGIVRGRRFVHDPRGHDALAVLSPAAAHLLDAADGRALGDIAQESGVPVDALAAELPILARNGFVTGPGVPSPPARRTPSRSFGVWVHVTNACNLDCPHCYIARDAHALSSEVADALLASLVRTAREDPSRALHVTFAGGEPMLRFGFLRGFFDRAKDAIAREGGRLGAAVLTNGTIVPDGAAAWLCDRRVSVSVSLDGLGAVQDAMRPALGGGGSFDRVRAGIDRLLAGGVRPYVLVTVSSKNLEQMPELTAWLLERGLGFRYSLVRDLEGGDALLDAEGPGWTATGQPRSEGLVTLRRRNLPQRDAPPMLAGDALDRVRRVFADCYDLVEAAMPVAPSFLRTHRFCDLDVRRPIVRACGAGDGYLAVSDRGRVSACQAALHNDEGAALDGGVSLASLGPALALSKGLAREQPGDTCASCRFRHSCAGGCPLLLYRRDGHARGRSPYCEVFRFVIPRILRAAALELIARDPDRDRKGHPVV